MGVFYALFDLPRIPKLGDSRFSRGLKPVRGLGVDELSERYCCGIFGATIMATDALLTDADREEALSWAYVRAIAGYVGYTVSEEDFDRDGIDLRIHAGGYLSPSIGLQLKATIRLGEPRSDGSYRFRLPLRNYDRLIRPSQIPRYLVVLDLPEGEADWLGVSPESLVMRKCCYWVSLKGGPPVLGQGNVTVRIPMANRFDPGALRYLIELSRQGA